MTYYGDQSQWGPLQELFQTAEYSYYLHGRVRISPLTGGYTWEWSLVRERKDQNE